MHPTLDRRHAATSQELNAKLHSLQQLCRPNIDPSRTTDTLSDFSSSYLDLGSDQWIEKEYEWALKEAGEYPATPRNFDADEDIDACSPSVYDPTLFSSPPLSPSKSASRNLTLHQRASSEKEKPLPDIPRTPSPSIRRGVPSPPASPRTPPSTVPSSHFSDQRSSLRSSSSTISSHTPPRSSLAQTSFLPPASPRVSSSAPSSPKLRTFPRPPSHNSTNDTVPPESEPVPRPNAVQRHATYPSITSTLELLVEQESDAEKRPGVYVTGEQKASVVNRNRSASVGRATAEVVRAALTQAIPSPKRRQRPALPTLSTSSSSPQLRTLASASSASTPSTATASPSPFAVRSVMPGADLVPLMPSSVPFSHASEDSDEEAPILASRWSLDTVASRPSQPSFLPMQVPVPDAGSQSSLLAKGRRRDRLMSFISRGRSGSLGKGTPPGAEASEERRSVSGEPTIVVAAPRPSFSPTPPLPPSPAPISLAPSTSSSLSSSPSFSDDSTLHTPIDSHDSHPSIHSRDSFGPPSPSSIPCERGSTSSSRQSSAGSHSPQNPSFEIPSDVPAPPASPPPEPTLPLPSPSMPSPSFLTPQRPQSFFSSLALKRCVRRRGKKLVITGVDAGELLGPAAQAMGELAQERSKRESELRYQNVVRWCESFGAIRKVDRRLDGSIHVYWREWEVADMVCRVQAQVFIKEVGRVSLAWHYIN